MPRVIEVQVNGIKHRIKVEPERSLLSILRDELDLTGTKYGCGEAQCGACTVLIDSKPARSCVTRIDRVEGKNVITIEGLEKEGRLHPVQEAFLKADAMQCGYCISGMIMSAVALLAEQTRPTRNEIIQHMNRNVCRCCTYQRIIAAIEMAAEITKGQSK